MNDHVKKLIDKYKGLTGKSFEERIEGFKAFHTNKEEQAGLHMMNDATDTYLDKVTGAYHAGTDTLQKIQKDPSKKIEKEDDLYKVMEAYVDKALESIIGKDKYQAFITKHKAEHKLNDEELRKMKGNLFGIYHKDNEGRGVNPLDSKQISDLKGMTGAEIKALLLQRTKNYMEALTHFYQSEAVGDLLKEKDLMDFAPYIHEEFSAAGIEHDDHPSTRSFRENYAAYTTYLTKGDMSKQGFRQKYEAKKKKA